MKEEQRGKKRKRQLQTGRWERKKKKIVKNYCENGKVWGKGDKEKNQ